MSMRYCAYIECIQNNILIRRSFEGYKTLHGLRRAYKLYCEKNKVTLLNWCEYTFNNIEEQKYNIDAYKILDRFNCKMFFEYWR